MRRLLVPCLAALVLLSGCASPDDAPPAAQESTTAPTTVTTVVGESRGPVFTDTLHLLETPTATPQPPDSYTDLRFPVRSFNDAVTAVTAGPDAWRFPVADGLTGLVGTAHFWVEVKGTVLNNPNPGAEGCFWEFRFLGGDEVTGEAHYAPCVVEGATVTEGVREIVFTFDFPAVAVQPDGELEFELYTQDFGRAPGATVELLTGSIPHDSRVQLAGLAIEVAPTLLLTT